MEYFLMVMVTMVVTQCVAAGIFPLLKSKKNSGRILGGEETTIEEYPYQISVRYKGVHKCGGSIISDSIIITTASCLDGYEDDVSDFSVRAGSSEIGEGGDVIQIKSFKIHEQYDFIKNQGNYDIGLLFLESPLSYSNSIQPIALPNATDTTPAAGSMVVITGWGCWLHDYGLDSWDLRVGSLPVVDHKECEKIYDHLIAITSLEFCTGYLGTGGYLGPRSDRGPGGGQEPCQEGDTGGPVVQDNKLVGLQSFNIAVDDIREPSVNTDVTELRSWITDNTGI